MDSPLVSLIVPNFNREVLIEMTLDSVLNQSYQNWECIIVDDGSTDTSMMILKKYQARDHRIIVSVRDREPKGAPTCRNIGLVMAKGEYVIYLDSDDILAPFCLMQRVNTFRENPDKLFLVFPSLIFQEQPADAAYFWNVDSDEDDIQRFLKIDVLWQTTGPIYKRDYLIALNGFREDLKFWQDFDLHLKCLFFNAPYRKCYNDPPDLFIRAGRTDTISRSTSFTGDKLILQKRIEFYYDLVSLLKGSIYKEKKEYWRTINSMLFFFSAQFVIRHGKTGLFVRNWKNAQRLTPGTGVSTLLSILYVFILKISFRFTLFKRPAAGYAVLFKNSLPDYFIMQNNKVLKVKLMKI